MECPIVVLPRARLVSGVHCVFSLRVSLPHYDREYFSYMYRGVQSCGEHQKVVRYKTDCNAEEWGLYPWAFDTFVTPGSQSR